MLRRSAAGNIRYALAAAGVAARRSATRGSPSCWRWSASAALASRPARRLSGGEQQRLALARALARDPAVLFLDEPTASLDPAATKAIEDIVRAVAARGIKVVMATHDLGEARRLAGDIVLLHRGRVIESGAAARILRRAAAPTRRRRSSPANCWSDARRGELDAVTAAMLHRRCARAARSPSPAVAQDKSIVVASTTSTQDSGLFGYLLPLFKQKTGIDVKVVAQGTGQALDTGRRGDADVVFVHAKSAEEKFLAEGFRREALSGDVQRLRPDRAEERSRRHQGHARTSSRRSRRSRTRPRRSSRAATAPARISPSSSSGRTPASTSRRTRAPGTSRSARAWARRSTPRRRQQRLCAVRPRHLALVQEPRRPRHRWSKATSGCSTSTASCW